MLALNLKKIKSIRRKTRFIINLPEYYKDLNSKKYIHKAKFVKFTLELKLKNLKILS